MAISYSKHVNIQIGFNLEQWKQIDEWAELMTNEWAHWAHSYPIEVGSRNYILF